MNREALFKSTTDNVATPQWLFDELDAVFHFDLDAAATPENAKCARFYTKEDDALKKSWGGGGLLQSSVWTDDRRVRQEGSIRNTAQRQRDRATAARQDGHEMVPRIPVLQAKREYSVFAGQGEIRRRKARGPVPIHDCDNVQ